MLTFEKANKKIARIEGGERDGEYLYLYNPDHKCCSRCSNACKNNKVKCCDSCLYKKKGGCNSCNIKLSNRHTFDSLSIKDGKIIPLPNENNNDPDHYFIAGQTGAGKSSMVGDILSELPKDIKKDIFIFSTFGEDDALDHLNPTRIIIDNDIIDDPIQKEELKDSIVVFDDIDKIQPEKLGKACRALRDDLLQNGRKMGIKVFTTSHQIMDYKRTRDSLNSTQKIIIFPQATSPHHIKRFLETYMGLDRKQSTCVRGINTRWILFSTTFPRYILWEKGCIILNKINDPDKKELSDIDLNDSNDLSDLNDSTEFVRELQNLVSKTKKLSKKPKKIKKAKKL